MILLSISILFFICLFLNKIIFVARCCIQKNYMEDHYSEKDMPKIDLPEDWLAGTDINPDLLSLYTDFPVRLKCEILILCHGGEVEASVNLNRFCVHQDEAVLLVPGTIFRYIR